MIALLITGAVAGASLLGLIFVLLIVVGALAVARIPLRYAMRGLRSTWLFLAFIALLQVFTVPQTVPGRVLWQWGRIVISSAGMRMAAVTVIRFAVLILGISLFSLSTRTTELTHGIEHLLRPLQHIGLPAHEFALTVVIALRFIPLLALEAERIAKAQASRGADFGRGKMGIFKRVARMLPLLVPLFVTSLRRAETLALAMEARCYMGGRGRTHLIRLSAHPGDALAVVSTLLLTSAPLVASWIDLDRYVFNWMSRL
jgi:energy-coupling factor transport system permease protein